MGPYLLGIDIGGGSVKCMVYSPADKAAAVSSVAMPAKALFAVGEFGYGMNLDEMTLAVKDCAAQCLRKGGIAAADIAAVSFSTLRHTLVALDTQGDVLFASPNRDARAVDQTMRLIDTCADEIYRISGHRPMPNLMACKLQWLRDTQPDLYEKTTTVFTVEDYFNFKLTGVARAERTNAGETMLYDLASNRWSDELIEKLALKRTMFPVLVDSGVVLGHITQKAAAELGLNPATLVVTGAGDTQSALLGMGVLNTGETGVSAGTTAPIQMLVDRPCIDSKGRTWAGVSALPGKYVAECNGGGMGIALEWIAGLLFGDMPKPVASLMAAAEKTGAGAGGAVSTIGAQIFNHSVLSLPIDQLMFSTTNYTPNAADRSKVSRAVLEGMALAIRANVEQLTEISGLKPSRLHISGGISQAAVFNEIVSDALSLPVVNPKYSEASALGAVICASMALGGYAALADASASLAENKPEISCCGGSYERIYEEWREMYASSFEATMPLGALINELRSDAKGDAGQAPAETVRLRIYADADLSEESVNMLREFGTVTYKNYRDGDMLEGDDMVAALKDYDVFITEVDIVDAPIIKQLPNLRMIGVCRGNPTNVDVEACSSAGIPVVYTPGRNADGVADLTVAFILSAARMIPQASAFLKEEGAAGDMGRMGAAYFRYQGTELWRQNIGIIGGGAIGRKVARRLLGFEANLLVYDPYLSDADAALMGARKVELDELLSQSAIITIHAPVTDETTGMIGREQFAKMKKGAWFINTARAALADYDALLEALKTGRLAGAALDVFPVEPPASDDPLLLMENVIATPHIAGNTKQVSIHQGIIMAENIEKLLRGEMGGDVINRKDIKNFSFSGEKTIDEAALDRLSANVVGVSDLDASKQEKTKPAAADAPAAVRQAAPATASPSADACGSGGYAQYMALIKQFLDNLSADEEVRVKTAGKDISFQITFKDNEESCYMYFNKGDIDAGLGVFPYGAAEVNLRMPIEIFDGMMRGNVNGANAAMTGKMSFTGNVRKAMSMQSILKLMMSSYEKAIKTVGDVDVAHFSQVAAPAQPAASTASGASASPKTSGGAAGYAKYMQLVKEFLRVMANDEEVKAKTAAKDISFQITFKDNEESCYIIFNKGEIDAGLGLIAGGQAEVNLRMPMEIFDGMMKGTINGANAAMTGKMSFTGNVRKAMSMQSILKLMMGAYEQAVKIVGEVDVAALGTQAPGPSTAQPSAPAAAELPQTTPPLPKQGFLGRLFGKKGPAEPERAAPACAPQVVAAALPEKPKTGDVRDDILQITNELYEKGLLTGIGGNISARCEDNPNHIWITPSSVFKGDLRADMMVRVDLDGNNVGDSELSASSEKMVHLAIYKRRPEIMSVIHSHAPKATLMALTGLKFLPISTDAAFIGDIPVVPFVIPGSPELGDMVGEAIGEHGSAVIMQNHGLVVAGASCRRAADNTEVVELTAEKIIECHMMGIEPALLPKEAQEELAELGKMLV
ncbi:MAG TPA: NAD(P)-dependent oxidoreductase [Clostridiales bacterium]|nr:NAD(P)-dependent oxidoreductase [Clostridiales bacterium]HQK72829.1 NAD(P)-dependent oxidoreductase [Clostridiales bacterium]